MICAAPYLVAAVRAGTIEAGKLVERPAKDTQPDADLKDLHPQVLTIAPRKPAARQEVRAKPRSSCTSSASGRGRAR